MLTFVSANLYYRTFLEHVFFVIPSVDSVTSGSAFFITLNSVVACFHILTVQCNFIGCALVGQNNVDSRSGFVEVYRYEVF